MAQDEVKGERGQGAGEGLEQGGSEQGDKDTTAGMDTPKKNQTAAASRVIPYYASGVMRPTFVIPPKKSKPFEIDRSQTISQILESADLDDPQTRATVVAYMSEVEEARYEAVLQKAELLEIPVRVDGPGNKVSILHDFRGEQPVYRTTMNANAAISSGANLLYPAPYSLNGTGVKVGVWDAGSVRNTHQEFNTTRVVKRNSTAALDDHATHVAGTVGAAGFTASAKGMAPNVSIDSWDWNSDYSEMTSSGAASATADARDTGRASAQ